MIGIECETNCIFLCTLFDDHPLDIRPNTKCQPPLYMASQRSMPPKTSFREPWSDLGSCLVTERKDLVFYKTWCSWGGSTNRVVTDS